MGAVSGITVEAWIVDELGITAEQVVHTKAPFVLEFVEDLDASTSKWWLHHGRHHPRPLTPVTRTYLDDTSLRDYRKCRMVLAGSQSIWDIARFLEDQTTGRMLITLKQASPLVSGR